MVRIMIIRHAEKPTADDSDRGVSETGVHDPHDLTVKGWQRAGALAHLLVPVGSHPAEPLAIPRVIFASAATKASPSLRPQHTVAPLARLLVNAPFDVGYAEGQEIEVADAVIATDADALICWHHEHIVKLVRAIAGPLIALPPRWPGDRFDMIWLLNRDHADAAWRFSQVPQLLLSGDSPDLIK